MTIKDYLNNRLKILKDMMESPELMLIIDMLENEEEVLKDILLKIYIGEFTDVN